MDYEDMDRRLKEHSIRLAILCSPHNPTGRVWERWELEKAMEVYAANDCFVLSDEIWSDLILPGYRHIPRFPSRTMRAAARPHFMPRARRSRWRASSARITSSPTHGCATA